MPTTPRGSTDLLFQAPPTRPGDDAADDDHLDDAHPADRAPRRSPARGAGGSAPGGPTNVRMLKGARQAAAGMKISDDQIRAVLEDPQDVQPDPKQPHRTRLTRDGVTVTTGNDGMILRVTRRR